MPLRSVDASMTAVAPELPLLLRPRAAVIFDVDGVLVDSPHERAWRESLQLLMRGPWRAFASGTAYHPGAFTSELYHAQVAGKPRLGGAQAVLEHFGVPDPAARAREYAQCKQQRLEGLIAAGDFAAYDDAVELVIALLARAYPLAAASSSKNANDLLARIDLAAYGKRCGIAAEALRGRRSLLEAFSVNVCGRDVGRGKPDPDLFLLAAAELWMPPARCVVVEDAPSGVEAAKAGGMLAVGIARGADAPLLAEARADRVVERLHIDVLAPLLAEAGSRDTIGSPAQRGRPDMHPVESELERVLAPPSGPGWRLHEPRYERSLESSIEARLTVANGFLGVRASRAASRGPAWITWQHTLTWSSSPRTYVAGLFDTPNADPAVPALVPAPDWLRLRLRVDDAPLLLRSGELVRHERTLDLRRGVLVIEWHQRMPGGRLVRLRTLRLVSLAERALGLQLMELAIDGPPAEVQLDALLEVGTTGLELLAVEPAFALWQTELTRKRLAIAHAASLRIDAREIGPAGRAPFSSSWRWKSGPEERVTLVRMVAFARRDEDGDDVAARAIEALARARESGWRNVVDAHVAAWAARWSASDVEIEGDEAAQKALRFAAYHLIGAANPEDERASIGARALTGDSYLGHVFWDTEVYVLPFFTLTWPEAARALLIYRYRTLDGARAKAARLGYRGALYAWESADTGEEVTPERLVGPEGEIIEVLCGTLEQHISADIAYAVWQYWRITADDEFLLAAGAEIVLETARFWASRAQRDADGRHHIRGVIGPDEYHERVDDNAFTNVMARWNIERGLETVALLQTRWPERGRTLRERLALEAAELAQWQEVAEGLVTGFDPSTQLIEQFAGYFDLEDIDLAAYSERTVPMDVVLGRDRTQASRVVKQADVVALLAMLPEAWSREAHEANFRYYEPRCGHGSSLSRGLHALVAARLGDTDLAYRYFCETAAIDLADTTGASAGGVRIAALGGLWQAAVLGFAGLHVRDDGIAVDPHLPSAWRAMRLRVQWCGRTLALRVTGDAVEATLERGEPMHVIVNAQPVAVRPGHSAHMRIAA